MNCFRNIRQAVLLSLFLIIIPSAFAQVPGYRGKRFAVYTQLGIIPIDAFINYRAGFLGGKPIPVGLNASMELEYIIGRKLSLRTSGLFDFSGVRGTVTPGGNALIKPSTMREEVDHHFGVATYGVSVALYKYGKSGVYAPLGLYFGPRIGLLLYDIYDRNGVFVAENEKIVTLNKGILVGLDFGHNILFKDVVMLTWGIKFNYGIFLFRNQLEGVQEDIVLAAQSRFDLGQVITLHIGLGFPVF